MRIMEQVLTDMTPAPAKIYAALTRDIAADLVVPVFFGAAEHENGVRRLWKALRHDCPWPDAHRCPAGHCRAAGALAQVIRTFHLGQAGRAALARVWQRRRSKDGMTLGADRVGIGGGAASGASLPPRPLPVPGEVVVLGRMAQVQPGEVVGEGRPSAAPRLAAAARPRRRPGDPRRTSGAMRRSCQPRWPG